MFKQFKNRKNIKRTFSTYLLSFLILIFSVTTVILIFSYDTSKTSLADEIVSSQTLSLEDKKTMIDSFIHNIVDTTYQVTLDSNVVVYTKMPENKFLFNEIQNKIETIDIASNVIVSIELFFEETDELITSNGANSIINEPLRLKWLNEIRSTDSHTLWTKPHTYIDSDFKDITVISYIQKLPISSDVPLGYMAVHVKESYLNTILGNSTNAKSIFIIHDDGTILSDSESSHINASYSYLGLDKILESEYENGYIMTNSEYNHQIINFIKLKATPWIIISETPSSVLTNKTKPLLTGTFITGIIALILATIVAYLLTLRLYSPIKRLVARTSSISHSQQTTSTTKTGKQSELAYVNSILDNLEDNEKALKKELHIYHPILKERLVKDLITNKFSSNTSINQQLSHLDIHLDDPNFCIFIIELNNYDTLQKTEGLLEINTLLFAIKNIAQETIDINDQGLLCDFVQGQVVILLNFDDYIDPEDYLSSLANRLNETYITLLGIETTISIGDIYSKINECYLSYQEAKDIMKYKMIFDNTILLYSDYNSERVLNYYNPIKDIGSLNEGIRLNQPDKLIVSINNIFEVLETKDKLSYENTYKVLNQILDTLQWSLYDLGYSPDIIWGKDFKLYKKLSQKTSLSSIKEWLSKLFIEACDYIDVNTTTEDSHVGKIKDFIENHHEEDIYLDLISDKMGLNTSYMSRMFKKETGFTILEFINETRITHAKNLLKTSDLSIKDIAKKVGYNNIHSFNRRFKADVGTTAGKYRELSS